MLKLNITKAAPTFTHRRNRKPGQNYSVKSPRSPSAADTTKQQAGCEHASTDTWEQVWTHSHLQAHPPLGYLPTSTCPAADPGCPKSSLMWSVWACPSPICRVSQVAPAHTGSAGSLTTQPCAWPASKRATATSTLRPATMPALCATAAPACVGLRTLHNTRSGGDTAVAFTRQIPSSCTICWQPLKPCKVSQAWRSPVSFTNALQPSIWSSAVITFILYTTVRTTLQPINAEGNPGIIFTSCRGDAPSSPLDGPQPPLNPQGPLVMALGIRR